VARRDALAQRRPHVLCDVDGLDGGDRRHHLTRLLLVQVEDAAEHPRLAGVDVPAGVGLGDQALELIGRAAAALDAHVDAEQAQDAVGDRRQRDDQRPEEDAEELQRPGDAAGDGLGAVDGIELGHHLAAHQLGAGDEQERDDRRDRDCCAVAERASERTFEQRRERRLAERADPDRGHRYADLDG